jgi:hypothetical protein
MDDEQRAAILAMQARQVDAMVSMATSCDRLREHVAVLCDAVSALSRQVQRMEERFNEQHPSPH